MDKRHFGNAEQSITDYFEAAKKKTFKDLEQKFIDFDNALLHNKAVEVRHGAPNGNGIIDKSIDASNSGVNKANADFNIDTNTNTNTNSKVLRRERKVFNSPKVIDISSKHPDTDSIDGRNKVVPNDYGAQNNDSSFNSISSGGNASTSTILIVIASFVIVAMLIIIALTILGEIGMLPLD